MGRKANVFVVGLDDFHLALLRTVRGADGYAFHDLIGYDRIVETRTHPMAKTLRLAERQLAAFDGPVDAIVGYWDFPTSTILPILRTFRGLGGPTLESVLKCEHKYWARLEQRRLVPDHVPGFAVFDPFDPDPLAGVDLDFPFWIKPVRAHSSQLGFRIRDAREFEAALAIVRDQIWRFAEPFDHILGYADLPAEVAGVTGRFCIAEEITVGRQCTLEGYVFDGEVVVYGVVDSRRGPNRSSFARYQYPSRLPKTVQTRMVRIAERVMRAIGYDDAPFNMEFFHDEARDAIWLLEVNARISKSHSPLFHHVEGASQMEVMLDVALGQRPEYPRGAGPFKVAAKFMLRAYGDALVVRVPSEAEIERVQARFPGTLIQVAVREGMRLAEILHQDSYSHEYAVLFLGARSERELLARYRAALTALPFRFAEPPGAATDHDEARHPIPA